MKNGDMTEYQDRKGNVVRIGDKLKLKDGKIGTVFYSGIVWVNVPADDFMGATTALTISVALDSYRGVKIKEA